MTRKIIMMGERAFIIGVQLGHWIRVEGDLNLTLP